MKLVIYKGFNKQFLENLKEIPLLDIPIDNKKNVLGYNRKFHKQLDMALLSLEENDSVWITYEEYSLIRRNIEEAIIHDNLEVTIRRNNLYPDYYPIEFEISSEVEHQITDTLNGIKNIEQSNECKNFISIYSKLVNADGVMYGSFYNFENDSEENIKTKDVYPVNLTIEDSLEESEYSIFLNDDIDSYLRDQTKITYLKPKIISIHSTNGTLSEKIQKSLKAYCLHYGIRLIKFHEKLSENHVLDKELIDIAKKVIKIDNFQEFRSIKFYKNPDIDKEAIEISQAAIIHEIIRQAEKSYRYERGNNYRDIFITASTGAGKSVMFQIPAVYLARKYQKLTIIIEPVKALMQDQKEKLNQAGYNRVATFNSDLITQVEKENVLQKIKSGQIDLLYLSPETLLSYSIETIIGEREIGLVIVDEAHIVTTWGVGFRPDYWYLGEYLNRLRNQIQTHRGMKRKVFHFPICAFTATAVNGGEDDSVSDTITSLYMENPIKYLGYIRRDDIHFDIICHENGIKLPKKEYEKQKCEILNIRLKKWLSELQKTIIYFPYASMVRDASKGIQAFSGITVDKRIGTYTGRNIDELSNESFNTLKRQTFDKFRSGITPIILATKAFGMGIDVNDVNNVYHYAVSGNLSDYIQEIGRAARKSTMEGTAITDFFVNDMNFMKTLFGMSQIKQYQIKLVLRGIYETYKNKKQSRNFLISPESFTYIFNGNNEDICINKLKICLLMIEKDLYDKYSFKVLISRPQSVFTKAFICIDREHEKKVLESEYGKHMTFAAKGRLQEKTLDSSAITDAGDIYTLDLKSIWENHYPNISFPQFKYWYFNPNSSSSDKIEIMPSIRQFIFPRQNITIEARGELLLSDLQQHILDDFEYIADTLYAKFRKIYFYTEDFAKSICEKYGIAKARMIANSLFELIDPNCRCVKSRHSESTGKTQYFLSNGNLKEIMRKSITRSNIMYHITKKQETDSYSGYISLMADKHSNLALKLLSLFDYITYEVSGGTEPEIFIRLNDPDKIKNIVMSNINYSNSYVTKARKKHDRDIEILLRFFRNLTTDQERWNYIENYFLGYDVLENVELNVPKPVKMSRSVDKENSYQTDMYHSWADLKKFFDESVAAIFDRLAENDIVIAEYLETTIKHSDEGNHILMSWPSKNTLICKQDTSDRTLDYFRKKGWHPYRIYDIDYLLLKENVN